LVIECGLLGDRTFFSSPFKFFRQCTIELFCWKYRTTFLTKVNISAYSLSLKYYTNHINYTNQALTRNFNSFSPNPLSSYKIVLFMTSLWIRSSTYEVQLHINYQVINSSFYLLNCTTKKNMMLTNLHFSQIVFDETDILSSEKYEVIYN